MPRDAERVRISLQQAALELFAERGYDAVTGADIARRAGVTGRTFFRHFADKRDVLFGRDNELSDILVAAIAATPAGMRPWSRLLKAYQAAEPLFVAHRDVAVPRQRLIASSPTLQERAMAKTQMTIVALVIALENQGTPGDQARLLVPVAQAAANQAVTAWFQDGSIPLAEYLVQAFKRVHDLTV